MEYIGKNKESFPIYEPFDDGNLQFNFYRIRLFGHGSDGSPILYKFYKVKSDGTEVFCKNYAVDALYDRHITVDSKAYKLIIRVGVFDENGWRFEKMVFPIVKFIGGIDYQYPYELKTSLYDIVHDDLLYRFGTINNGDLRVVNRAISNWVDNYLAEIGD